MNFFKNKGLLLLSILFLIFVLPLLLRPSWFPSDDAYFYLQIAINIFKGKGSTFHSITPTNGYHPLWMVFCVLAAFIAQGDTTLLLYVVVLIQIALFVGVAIYFVKVASIVTIKNSFMALPLIATYFLCLGQIASEGHLYGFMVMLSVWYYLTSIHNITSSNAIVTGILFGLLFLSRLDSIFLISAFIVYDFFYRIRSGQRNVLYRLCLIGIAFTLVAAPYLWYNFSEYGHLTPISGKIKSTFPAIEGKILALGNLGLISVIFSIGMLIYCFFKKHYTNPRGMLFIPLSIGVIMHAFYIILFTNHSTTYAWYYVPGVINICFVFAVIVDWLSMRMPPQFQRTVIPGVFIAISITGSLRGWSEFSNPDAESFNPFQLSFKKNWKWQIEIGRWLKTHLAPGENILIYDWPGMIAYHSGMDILPTDGLINDYKYNDEIMQKGIDQFMIDHNIRYVIGPIDSLDRAYYHYARYVNYPDSTGQTVYVFTPLGAQPAGKFRIENSNKIVYFPDVIKSSQVPKLALWKINSQQ